MSTKAIPDEEPKKKVARRVVTQKRLYFVPEHGRSVEAADGASAVDLVTKQVKQEEVGDAE